jgi:RNA polymerase sigma factor for flagellar operon FliA
VKRILKKYSSLSRSGDETEAVTANSVAATAPQTTGSAIDYRREDELVRDNLPLVGYIVSEMIGRLPAHVTRDELTSAGLAALAQAARGYDAERGVPFARFASTRIRGALIDELRTHDWASRSVRARARKRNAAEEQLTASLGRTPTVEEVAGFLGCAVTEIDSVQDDVQRAVVLSLQGFGDLTGVEEMAVEREAGPEELLLHNEKLGYLHDAVAVLPDRLRTVVTRYFFEERPMAEIAVELGVSESRVSQMRAEALVLLRDGMNASLEPVRVPKESRPQGCAARRRESYYAAIAARSDYRSRLAPTTVDGRASLAAVVA